VVANIQKTGRKVAGFQYDISSVSDVQKFIAESAGQFGKIDVLVNNAGLERRADFCDVTESDFDAVLNVNLKGLFFVTRAFVKNRMAAPSGDKRRLGTPDDVANMAVLVASEESNYATGTTFFVDGVTWNYQDQ
jgi:NAD(P)-dependent dehydrogenase (short-subunit alcohol dehydrogenase family)